MSKENLRSKITDGLTDLINNDYIFLDLPYYTNIGDTLIWKGTESFLYTLPYSCRYKSSIENYVKPKIGEDVIILLQGGGNFGDIWRRHTEFCLKILHDFPHNKVIILPQTIYYKSDEVMVHDINTMSLHKKLHICARDERTYKLLLKNFSFANILLLPDMAFCIPDSFFKKYSKPERVKTLFFNRKDAEAKDYNFKNSIPDFDKIDEHEWPSMESRLFESKILGKLQQLSKFIRLHFIVDIFAQKIFMPKMLKIGIEFIDSYSTVYSTRLHGAILSILLGKKVYFFDNSYGKNSGFYNTWLKDISNIQFIGDEDSEY